MFGVGALLRRSDLPPSVYRRARPGSSEVCSPVSASKEIHSFSGIVRKTVETRVSINDNAAMIVDTDPEERFSYLRLRVAEAKL